MRVNDATSPQNIALWIRVLGPWGTCLVLAMMCFYFALGINDGDRYTATMAKEDWARHTLEHTRLEDTSNEVRPEVVRELAALSTKVDELSKQVDRLVNRLDQLDK